MITETNDRVMTVLNDQDRIRMNIAYRKMREHLPIKGAESAVNLITGFAKRFL